MRVFIEDLTIAVIVDVFRTHSAEELERSLGKGNMILDVEDGTGMQWDVQVHTHSVPGQISTA